MPSPSLFTPAAIVALALLVAGCSSPAESTAGAAGGDDTAAPAGGSAPATEAGGGAQEVMLVDAEGAAIGSVQVSEADGRVTFEIAVREGLTAGFHGFHVHAAGICDPAAAEGPFMSAGDHYDSGDAMHGGHAGDLPPLQAGQSGGASATLVTDAMTLAELADADGSALVVHAAPDNFANIPERYVSGDAGVPGPDEETLGAGDSGDRVACGVLAEPSA